MEERELKRNRILINKKKIIIAKKEKVC